MTSDRQHERLREGKELGERLDEENERRERLEAESCLIKREDRESYTEGISGQILNSLIDLFFY